MVADCVHWEWLFDPLIKTLMQLLPRTRAMLLSITHRFGRSATFLEKIRIATERRGYVFRCVTAAAGGRAVLVNNTDIYEVVLSNAPGAVFPSFK